ncbi:hypothetical protein ABFS82_01G076500 [Erythranthe guttata]
MANLISSALCILIILFFSSGGCSANATDLAAASPPKSEPCYTWLGVCSKSGSEAEKNQLCKKRCTAYFHKEHDGFCAEFEGTAGLCFCPVDCDSD